MKVAIVHDWLVIYGGAERVLEHIIDAYPDADIFSLIDGVPLEQRGFLRGKIPKLSFMQKIPGVYKYYRKMLPIMPYAIEQLDLSAYDLVISSSYCVAKGVITGPNQVHVCYCHSPMRYAWDHYFSYLKEMKLETGIKSLLTRIFLHKIRIWDVQNSFSVDLFIANSRFVRERIWKFYRRKSQLLYPPIDTELFTVKKELAGDFYVAAGRFVPFKRLDLVAEAFSTMPDKNLVLIGDGPEMEKIRLKAQGQSNITFLGFASPVVMQKYLSEAKALIFPSEEDFGILPVEAQACGTPVIAYAKGGALETVIGINHRVSEHQTPKPTGLFFFEQTAESLREAVKLFETLESSFDTQSIADHAKSYSPKNFKSGLTHFVNLALREKAERLQS